MKRILVSLFLLTPHLLLAQPGSKLEDLLAAEQAARTAGDQAAVILALENLGEAHQELDDLTSALASFRQALKLARETGDKPPIARNLLAIGRIHVREGRIPGGAETLRRAAAAASEIGAEDVLREAHGSLSQAYATLGQYRQAYESAQRAAELEEAGTGQRTGDLAAELEARLEDEREARELKAARQQEELQRERRMNADRESEVERLAAMVIAGGGVLSALLLFSFVSRHRLKARVSQEATQKDAGLSRFESQLQHSSDERDRLSTLRDQALGESRHLTSALEETTGERDRLSALRDQALGESRRLTSALEETAGERDRLSGELERTSAKLQRTADQLENTFVKLKQTTAERDRVTADRNRVASELEHSTAEHQRAAAEVEQLSERLAPAAGEIERLSAQLEQTTTERRNLTTRLGETSDELARLRHDCRQDISAMADRNAAARDRLVEMERFNSTLSQHLKVLLVAVRSALGALQQDAAAGDVEQLQKDVRRTHRAIGKTVRLLDELQKLLLVGRVVNAPEAVSMSELAFEAVGQVAGLADRRVDVVIAPSMPAVYGDRSQLLEVLRRLLENGGKYMGAQPSPRLEVAARKHWPRADKPETVFYVRDNGIGIEPRDQKRIFTLFERLESEGEGLGISLALVKRIVEAHGGRIWVESEGASRGSTFCFTLSEPKPPAPLEAEDG